MQIHLRMGCMEVNECSHMKWFCLMNGSNGQFTCCNNVGDNVNFFLTPTVGSMATNASVHTHTCVSDFNCNIDLNGEVIFVAVVVVKCELTLRKKHLSVGEVMTKNKAAETL